MTALDSFHSTYFSVHPQFPVAYVNQTKVSVAIYKFITPNFL